MSWLDRALNELKAAGPDRRLDQLEPLVWRRIEASRQVAPSVGRGLLPLRVAAVIAALGVGVTAGGLAAAQVSSEQPEISVFSLDASFAPSTLLEGRG